MRIDRLAAADAVCWPSQKKLALNMRHMFNSYARLKDIFGDCCVIRVVESAHNGTLTASYFKRIKVDKSDFCQNE